MIIGMDASRALRSRRTGTEQYSLAVIRHLLALPEAAAHSWRLYLDAPDPDDRLGLQQATSPTVERRVLPAARLWTHCTLARELLLHPPDVLFVPAHVLPLLPVRLPPSVVTVHDLGYHTFSQLHTRWQRWYLEAGTRWSTHQARRVIAVSQATADDLQTRYQIPPAQIRVIHEAAAPPLPVTPAQLATTQARHRLKRPYALFVGTIQPRKNIARLLAAYQQLSCHHSLGWDLVLAGAPGWQSATLLKQASGLVDQGRVHFLGYLPDAELPPLLSGATFFAFPSLFEGFGLPVLEAQSYGVPVLTSNHSSLPEVAGKGALLVDPTDVDAIADAMLRLSQEETLRQQLVAAGYANLQRFSWEKAARQTLAVLCEAANEPPP